MKQVLILILLVSQSLVMTAQDDSKAIQAAVDEYFDALEVGDYGKMLDMVHPKLYEFTSKESMLELFEGMLNDPEVRMSMHNYKVVKVSDRVKHEGVNYALVDYEFVLTISFNTEIDDGDATYEVILTTYQNMYGKDNVSFDDTRKSYFIHQDAQMFAIYDPAIGTWKFFENSPEMSVLLDAVVPPTVVDQLK